MASSTAIYIWEIGEIYDLLEQYVKLGTQILCFMYKLDMEKQIRDILLSFFASSSK